jgi:hypothetical protein
MSLQGRPCVLGTDGTARHDLCLASDRCYKEEALASPAAVDIFTTLDDVRATVCRGGSVQPHLQAVIVIARKGAEKCNQTQRKAMQCRHVLAVHRWRKRCYEFSCHGLTVVDHGSDRVYGYTDRKVLGPISWPNTFHPRGGSNSSDETTRCCGQSERLITVCSKGLRHLRT